MLRAILSTSWASSLIVRILATFGTLLLNALWAVTCEYNAKVGIWIDSFILRITQTKSYCMNSFPETLGAEMLLTFRWTLGLVAAMPQQGTRLVPQKRVIWRKGQLRGGALMSLRRSANSVSFRSSKPVRLSFCFWGKPEDMSLSTYAKSYWETSGIQPWWGTELSQARFQEMLSVTVDFSGKMIEKCWANRGLYSRYKFARLWVSVVRRASVEQIMYLCLVYDEFLIKYTLFGFWMRPLLVGIVTVI